MLFDRIPGMVGSGVIPRQYLAIRAAVKETVLRSFFDRAFLEVRAYAVRDIPLPLSRGDVDDLVGHLYRYLRRE